jgi:ribonuclease G
MAEEILINVTPREIRIALLENRVLQEIFIERNSHQGLIGNIYKGKVSRILPGIQAAFVDIGLERAAFIHISDIRIEKMNVDICNLLRPGQSILVQVYKDPLGGKGARLTTQFTIPARYLVLTPGLNQVSVSQKITDEIERQRLLNMIKVGPYGGFIFRTNAQNATQAEIDLDKEFLNKCWEQINSRAKQVKTGELVYKEIPILLRVLRDLAGRDVTKIRVDTQEAMQQLYEYALEYAPSLAAHIEYYSDSRPLFDLHKVEDELQQLLQRKVLLKSGGYIVFDQTEAMTTIDVNSGSYSGRENADLATLKTNLEAVEMIVRQMRLRNLGGIIVIDFIDMANAQHKTTLLGALTAALTKDTAKTEISEISNLSLVQMTRKRTRESLEHILCVMCPLCQRRGSVKSLETVCYDIFRELKRTASNFDWKGFLVLASQEVINYLMDVEYTMLADLEVDLGKPIECRVELSYTQEQYDILPKAL